MPGKFIEILPLSALANLVLVPALVWEGIVKGFSATMSCEFQSSRSTFTLRC